VITSNSFFIIGRDGKQYGPATQAMLSEWFLADLISLTSLAWSPGEEEWRQLKLLLRSYASNRPPLSLASNQADLAARFQRWVELRGFEVGQPTTSVDSRSGALLMTAGGAALKFALRHLTKQPIHGKASVRGVQASAEAVAGVVAPLLPRVNVLALRNDFLHGARSIVVTFADDLTAIELAVLIDLIAETGLNLAQFAVVVNGQQRFFVMPIFLYHDSSVYESHRGVIAKLGYDRRAVGSRGVVSHGSIVDVTTMQTESPSIKGMIGKMMAAFGHESFGMKHFAEVLATPPAHKP
jgi:hypothetical protein